MSQPPSSSPPAWVAAVLGWPGLALALVWGLAEGALFFVVPDVVITLAALHSVRRSLGHVAMVLVGSLMAGAAMFAWAANSPSAERMVRGVPLVSAAMFRTVDEDFGRLGAWAMCKGPMSGIPYKVYAVRAPAHVRVRPFMLATVPARLERLLISWSVFAVIGWLFARWLRPRPGLALAFHALYWTTAYAWYWRVI